MKISFFPYAVVAAALVVSVQLSAQTGGKSAASDIAAGAMDSALKFRVKIVEDVTAGTITIDDAIKSAQGQRDVMGLGLSGEIDLAMGTADLGQRLLAAHKPQQAERFFIESEQALGRALGKTAGDAAQAKADLLEQRAFSRANFLNRAPEADADLAEAIKLRPDDKRLQRKRDLLPADQSGRKNDQPKG